MLKILLIFILATTLTIIPIVLASLITPFWLFAECLFFPFALVFYVGGIKALNKE